MGSGRSALMRGEKVLESGSTSDLEYGANGLSSASGRSHLPASRVLLSALPRWLRALLPAALLLAQAAGSAVDAEPSEMVERIAAVYKNQLFRLIVNVHQPQRGGRPAPFLDEEGWHYRDLERPIILAAGDLVEVTEVFPYGDRSVFLELSRPSAEEIFGVRPRVRVRIVAEGGPEEPVLQEEQIRALIARMMVPLFPLIESPRDEPPPEGGLPENP